VPQIVSFQTDLDRQTVTLVVDPTFDLPAKLDELAESSEQIKEWSLDDD
jgi:hypothetical protein